MSSFPTCLIQSPGNRSEPTPPTPGQMCESELLAALSSEAKGATCTCLHICSAVFPVPIMQSSVPQLDIFIIIRLGYGWWKREVSTVVSFSAPSLNSQGLSRTPETVNPLPNCCPQHCKKVLPKTLVAGYEEAFKCHLPEIMYTFPFYGDGRETGARKEISILEPSSLWLRFGLWLSGTWVHPCFCHLAWCHPTNH